MIDFVKLATEIPNWTAWRKATPHLALEQRFNVDSGEVITKSTPGTFSFQTTTRLHGELDRYKVIVVRSTKEPFHKNYNTVENNYLYIYGSLHKNHFKGENHSSFSWSALQKEIDKVSSLFSLDESKTRLNKLEVGMNILLHFPVYDFLRESLIGYKGEPFSRYKPDRKGIVIGYECGLTHYTVKAYDKGMQYGLSENILRFELSYKNMASLRKRGIYCLSDLRNPNIMSDLHALLLKGWDDVMLCDLQVNSDKTGLKVADSRLLDDGRNPKYWEQLKNLNRVQFNYQRRKYKKLLTAYGKNQHELIHQLLQKQCHELMDQ